MIRDPEHNGRHFGRLNADQRCPRLRDALRRAGARIVKDRQTDAVADELVRRKQEVDEEQAAEVIEALREVLAELEGAFEE